MVPHRPFLIAVQFLTVLPTRLKEFPENEDTGRSLLYYPLVGALIGLLLAAVGWAGSGMPAGLHAAVLLALWVALTGALHLDGLADSADAWVGGHGDRERTLAIMKDPYCGPAAVVTLVSVLLIKFTALEQLLAAEDWKALVLIPVLARTALPLLFLTTPYVRPGGLGAMLSGYLPRRAGALVVMITLFTVLLLGGATGAWLLLVSAGMFLGLRALMIKRIGGATGDTAGALVELTETTGLVTAVLLNS